MTIFGSLVLQAERDTPEFALPELASLSRREGHHVSGRYNGSYIEYYDVQPIEVMAPHRYKRMTVLADPWIRHDLSTELSGLDAKHGEARQLYKLNELMKAVPGQYCAVVNIVNTNVDDTLLSGAFCLLASGSPIYVALAFNSRTGSVQLVWATFDIKAALHQRPFFDYAVYPLPTLTDRPLFVPSQSLCSQWWRRQQRWANRRYGNLVAANALELMLYKDPTLPTLENGLR